LDETAKNFDTLLSKAKDFVKRTKIMQIDKNRLQNYDVSGAPANQFSDVGAFGCYCICFQNVMLNAQIM